jgi:deoxyribodipyrimidine photo-lyase
VPREAPALVWFDRDLRLDDNPALHRAIVSNRDVVPVFIWSPEEEDPPPGSASRWWLRQSLEDLQAALASRGSKLIVRRGPAADVLLALAAESGARHIFWNRRYEPAALARDRRLESRLHAAGIAFESCPGNLWFEPGTILNSSGRPYQVFTKFWRACLAHPGPADPYPAPSRLPAPAKWPASLALSSLHLEPERDRARGLRQAWRPGEYGAAERMNAFGRGALAAYPARRDSPAGDATSRLSPHLQFGEISARQIWHQVCHSAPDRAAADAWLRQIAWREFSSHLLFHFPHTVREPLRPEFRLFPWRTAPKALQSWTRGETGYPLVDAGMRQLWQTGFMHNRVRMVAASFLVKHLLIRWQEGAAWFWETLADAGLANNTMGWQWSAGCGADAQPFFRIFNPVLQGIKFDPEGAYVRRWVPELSRLPSAWIHQPWKAPAAALLDAGVRLGKVYPRPIVDHDAARERALAALALVRASRERAGG